MVTTRATTSSSARQPARRRRQQIYWTLGNLLLFGGVYLLLFVGGIYADVEYQRMAARGDSDIEAPRMVMGEVEAPARMIRPAPHVAPAAPRAATAAGAAFEAPVLAAEGQIATAPPDAAAAAHTSTVQRVLLPSIKVDAKVIEVGWEIVEQGGQQLAIWEVAEFAVGQHRGSANPGEGDNVVLAGHVGGYGKVFRDLYYVLPGDPVVLYSEGRQFQYVVTERYIVDEEGVSAEQHAANAAFIAPTGREMVTLVTCWPLTGPKKFTQRVIIRATPYETAAPATDDVAPQSAR